ncbi:glycosyl hydrolase [bacterium]|nr:glycosyl hydrolase [bacterium]
MRFNRTLKFLVLPLFIAWHGLPANAATNGGDQWISSNGKSNWVRRPAPPPLPSDGTLHRVVRIHPDSLRQVIHGFGGCFNERGWDALSILREKDRTAVISSLFDSQDGCRFNLCRMPIGASDYAMDWYSLNDHPGDLAMRNFSIRRDRLYLIPFIKAALAVNPDMRLWGSPWSPPAWMKENNHYACQGQENPSRLIWKPEILSAYAHYLSLTVQYYRREGIPVYAVHVQNEPHACQVFPSCLWSGEELRDFIRDYLAPRFRKDRLDAEIWLGTINHGDYRRYAGVVLADSSAASALSGVGYQWDGKHAIAETHRRHPGLQLMQTESECGDGSNDPKAAFHTFALIKTYLEGGANAYLYWNMVLDHTGLSTWGWSQNSLIGINRHTAEVIYHFEYYVLKHFSSCIDPGAHRIGTSGEDADVLAFRNPDESLVVILANPSFTERTVTVAVGSRMYRLLLEEGSVHSLLLKSILK